FHGGFTFEAAEAVTAGDPADVDPLEGIMSLVGKSLAFVELLDETVAWYRILETIREFAQEQLDVHGETGALRRRHAEYTRDVADRAQSHLLVPAERGLWLARFERGLGNVRAALGWSLSDDGDLRVGVALAGPLGWFWLTSGRLIEGQAWLDRLVARRGV